MDKNREGFLVSETQRECTQCHEVFEKTSKTVTLCNKCNSERVKSQPIERKMFQRAKSRAKESNREFDIEVTDIVIPIHCPILGIPLIEFKGYSGGRKDSPALDRIDSSKGYVKGNIQVISHLANMMKSSATKEELLTFAEWIIQNPS